MALAMLSIPTVDGLAKYLSAGYSPLFLGWARYAVATLIVLPIAAVRHGTRVFPTEGRVSHVVRTLCLVISMTLYFLALARIPLRPRSAPSSSGRSRRWCCRYSF